MRPRDRYQFVADFANDLKNVIRAFPGSQPLSNNANRPGAHPHAANAQPSFQQGSSGEHNTTSTQPMPEDIACPRCSFQLPASSLFCPRCGAKLTPSVQNSTHTPILARRVSPSNPNPPTDLSDSNYHARVKVSSKTPAIQQRQHELPSNTPMTPGVPHRSSQVTPQARSLQQNHTVARQHVTDQVQHSTTNQHNVTTWVSFIIVAIIILLLVILLIFATQGNAHAQIPAIIHETSGGIYLLLSTPSLVSAVSRVQFSL